MKEDYRGNLEPQNPRIQPDQAERSQRPGGPLRRFFINLAVWIVIVVVVLFILDFVVPRFR